MSIKIKINPNDKKEQKIEKIPELQYKSKIRKSLDGNLMLSEHEDIDIVIIPKKMKIITFAKEILDDKIYETQNRLFKFLIKKGLVKHESVHSGNVYGSLEGKIPSDETKTLNSIDIVILNVIKWLEKEKPGYMYSKSIEKDKKEDLLNPDMDHSTELGEIPQMTDTHKLTTMNKSISQKYY